MHRRSFFSALLGLPLLTVFRKPVQAAPEPALTTFRTNDKIFDGVFREIMANRVRSATNYPSPDTCDITVDRELLPEIFKRWRDNPYLACHRVWMSDPQHGVEPQCCVVNPWGTHLWFHAEWAREVPGLEAWWETLPWPPGMFCQS